MAVHQSCDEERSLFDVALLHDTTPAEHSLAVLCRDGLTVEVKADYEAFKTGNAFIETGRKSGEDTGIFITGADLWAHLLGRVALITAAPDLSETCRQMQRRGITPVPGGDFGATLGLLLSLPDLLAVSAGRLESTPRVFTVTYQEDSLAAEVLSAGRAVRNAKATDQGMSFKPDLGYGNDGERYIGAVLDGLADPRTAVQEQTQWATVRAGECEARLLAKDSLGGLAGFPTAKRAQLCVFDFGGVWALIPTYALLSACRPAFARGTLRRGDGTAVMRVPLLGRNQHRLGTAALLTCAGPELPAGLPAPPPAAHLLHVVAAA